MKVISQRSGSRECVGCVAAMAANSTLEAFQEFTGRPAPWHDVDAALFLLAHGILMGGMGAASVNGEFPGVVALELQDSLMLIVRVEGPRGMDHYILWDGAQVLDPDRNRQNTDWTHYRILSVYPLTPIPFEYWRDSIVPKFNHGFKLHYAGGLRDGL